MVRPVTPPDDSKISGGTDSMHKEKSPASTSSTNNVVSSSSNTNISLAAPPKGSSSQRSSERKIIVTGNPETLLTKLFENVEDKPVVGKKPEIPVATGASYKVPVPPNNTIRRTR